MQAAEEKKREIPPEELREFFKRATNLHKPSRGKGVRHPKILGFKQIGADPPVFEAVIKHKTSLHHSYIYYLKNRLREQYSFFASPIIIKLRKVKK
jgi:GTPase